MPTPRRPDSDDWIRNVTRTLRMRSRSASNTVLPPPHHGPSPSIGSGSGARDAPSVGSQANPETGAPLASYRQFAVPAAGFGSAAVPDRPSTRTERRRRGRPPGRRSHRRRNGATGAPRDRSSRCGPLPARSRRLRGTPGWETTPGAGRRQAARRRPITLKKSKFPASSNTTVLMPASRPHAARPMGQLGRRSMSSEPAPDGSAEWMVVCTA